jgi:hypothetical protein
VAGIFALGLRDLRTKARQSRAESLAAPTFAETWHPHQNRDLPPDEIPIPTTEQGWHPFMLRTAEDEAAAREEVAALAALPDRT